MISGRDIVFISSIDWRFLWQGHQEIASRLAQAGNRILYIENTGVRSPGVADFGRVAERLVKWARSLRSGGVREVAPNIHVCSPLVLPPFGPRWQRFLNRRVLLTLVRRITRKLRMQDPLIWTYLPTDTALDLIQLLRTPRSLVAYYCIADFEQLTPWVNQVRQSEKDIIECSDVIFASRPELAERSARWNRNVHVFPFGVNLDAFPLVENSNGDAAPEVEDRSGPGLLQSLPRPIIGYVGGLHRHLDYGMLAEMARACPDWSWVFVGAIQTSVADLAGLPNVYLLGQQEHDTLVRYIRQFDVCIVPYVNSPVTATVVPTKINEYLAVGKPVVSTELPAVREFNAQHDILQTTSTEPKNFLLAIERALQLGTDEATIARGRAVAELGNWDSRLEAMIQVIETKLTAQANTGATPSIL
ncbi:MAG: glycosyltransferase [Pyrinomonadaceae bacterium]